MLEEEEEASIDNKGSGKGGEEGRGVTSKTRLPLFVN